MVNSEDAGETAWAWGWYDAGGKKFAYPYLPTVNYPRLKDGDGPIFPLYRHTQSAEIDALRGEVEKLKWSLDASRKMVELLGEAAAIRTSQIAQLRDRVAGLEEMLGRWVTWSCGQQGPSPFNETRALLTQNEVG